MTQLNIWGQIALMMGSIQSRRDHLASLTATAKIHRRELKTMSKDLETELTKLQTAEQLFEQAKKDSESEQGNVNFLQESIARLCARPEINRIDQAKLPNVNKVPPVRGATPLSTPIAGKRGTTPGSTPDTGLVSSGTGLHRPSLSSRSALGTTLNHHLGGNESDSSSSDDEEEDRKIMQDEDSDHNGTGKGKGNTVDDDDTKEDEIDDDLAPRKFTDLTEI